MKKYELTTVQGKDIVIDISQLFKEEVLYINATRLAKQFGKNSKDLYQFLNTKAFREYEDAVNRIHRNIDTIDDILVKKNTRGKYAGTYLHSSLVIYFLRWLDVEFAVKCDLYLKQKIQEAHDELITTRATIAANKANDNWVLTRETGKATRRSLTDTIKSFCKYAEDSREAPYRDSQCPYYPLLSKLVYDVLEIKRPKGKKPLRDVFSAPIVAEIKRMENILMELIDDVTAKEMEYHKAFKYIRKAMIKEIPNEMGHFI